MESMLEQRIHVLMHRVLIRQDGETIAHVDISESSWRYISYVDYIEIDQYGRLEQAFIEAYPADVCDALRELVRDATHPMQMVWANERAAEQPTYVKNDRRR